MISFIQLLSHCSPWQNSPYSRDPQQYRSYSYLHTAVPGGTAHRGETHNGHRMWTSCNCAPWNDGGCWHWTAVPAGYLGSAAEKQHYNKCNAT